MYWLETQVATELRARRRPPAADARRHQGPRPADRARARRRRVLLGVPGGHRRGHLRGPVPALVLARRAPTPGFWDWSSTRRSAPDRARGCCTGSAAAHGHARSARGAQRWRERLLLRGLVVLVIALDSPIDPCSEQLFWVAHGPARAAAHRGRAPDRAGAAVERAVAGAAAGRPALAGARRSARARAPAPCGRRPLRSAARCPASCCSPWCCSAGTCRRCSTPRCARRRCTRSSTRCSSVARLLFWKQVIASPPLRARLSAGQRVAVRDRAR